MAVVLAGIVADPSRVWACDRSDFAQVVDGAGADLRTINDTNKDPFQRKLRRLQELKGWSDQQFLVDARPFVQDETIAGFDKTSERLLDEIGKLGGEGSAEGAADCALLPQLAERMRALVENTRAKWAYMNQKLDAAVVEAGGP